jgi:hypothetical protein
MSGGPPGYPPLQQYPYASGYDRPDAPGATASLVLAIVALCALPFVCCCGLGELVTIPCGVMAVVFGINATRRVSASQGMLAGNGKAIAAIIIGGSALAIGVVLAMFVLITTVMSPPHVTPQATPQATAID